MSYPDRLAVARDALLHLMKDLQKILQEGIQAVLVCPHWPTVLWWPVLVDMLVEPLLIATCSSILYCLAVLPVEFVFSRWVLIFSTCIFIIMCDA